MHLRADGRGGRVHSLSAARDGSEMCIRDRFETEIATAPATAAAQYSLTTSAIDKAAAKGILHKNTASRKKARLARCV